jgi:hypothetical protein
MTRAPDNASPQGAIAIVHWPDGDILASCSDFGTDCYGGCSKYEGQKIRARDDVKRAAIRKLCHDDVANTIERYHLDAIIQSMINKLGYSISFIPVGYEDEAIEKTRKRT